jgi:hypothetical protein
MKPEWEAADFGVLGSKLHRSNFAALQRNVTLDLGFEKYNSENSKGWNPGEAYHCVAPEPGSALVMVLCSFVQLRTTEQFQEFHCSSVRQRNHLFCSARQLAPALGGGLAVAGNREFRKPHDGSSHSHANHVMYLYGVSFCRKVDYAVFATQGLHNEKVQLTQVHRNSGRNSRGML